MTFTLQKEAVKAMSPAEKRYAEKLSDRKRYRSFREWNAAWWLSNRDMGVHPITLKSRHTVLDEVGRENYAYLCKLSLYAIFIDGQIGHLLDKLNPPETTMIEDTFGKRVSVRRDIQHSFLKFIVYQHDVHNIVDNDFGGQVGYVTSTGVDTLSHVIPAANNVVHLKKRVVNIGYSLFYNRDELVLDGRDPDSAYNDARGVFGWIADVFGGSSGLPVQLQGHFLTSDIDITSILNHTNIDNIYNNRDVAKKGIVSRVEEILAVMNDYGEYNIFKTFGDYLSTRLSLEPGNIDVDEETEPDIGVGINGVMNASVNYRRNSKSRSGLRRDDLMPPKYNHPTINIIEKDDSDDTVIDPIDGGIDEKDDDTVIDPIDGDIASDQQNQNTLIVPSRRKLKVKKFAQRNAALPKFNVLFENPTKLLDNKICNVLESNKMEVTDFVGEQGYGAIFHVRYKKSHGGYEKGSDVVKYHLPHAGDNHACENKMLDGEIVKVCYDDNMIEAIISQLSNNYLYKYSGPTFARMKSFGMCNGVTAFKDIIAEYKPRQIRDGSQLSGLFSITKFAEYGDLEKYLRRFYDELVSGNSTEELFHNTIGYILVTVLNSIAALQMIGIQHNDLKPDNIFMFDSTKEMKHAKRLIIENGRLSPRYVAIDRRYVTDVLPTIADFGLASSFLPNNKIFNQYAYDYYTGDGEQSDYSPYDELVQADIVFFVASLFFNVPLEDGTYTEILYTDEILSLAEFVYNVPEGEGGDRKQRYRRVKQAIVDARGWGSYFDTSPEFIKENFAHVTPERCIDVVVRSNAKHRDGGALSFVKSTSKSDYNISKVTHQLEISLREKIVNDLKKLNA
jgi:serine/threonine protein kinase